MTDPYIKQDLVSHEPYRGRIKRQYLDQPKYLVAEINQKPRVVYCYKSLEEMKEKYPDAIIKEIR